MKIIDCSEYPVVSTRWLFSGFSYTKIPYVHWYFRANRKHGLFQLCVATLCNITPSRVTRFNAIVTGNVTITGHETPLIIGLPRDIVCTWSGEENAAKIEWFLSGLDAGPIESAINSSSLVLSPDASARGLDGAILICRVTTFGGSQFEESITVEVKGLAHF